MSGTDPLLVAYVDGELDAQAAREVERLIATDPQAREAVEMYRATAGLLRAACGEHVYAVAEPQRLLPRPPGLLRRAVRRHGRVAAMAMAATVVGFLAGAGWALWPPDARDALVDEVAEYHAIYAREQRPLDLVGPERAGEIEAWLGQGLGLGRPLRVPELGGSGLRFAGARLLVVGGRRVAQLMYARAYGLPVALCITRMDGLAALEVERHGAQRTAAWQDGSYAYVVVGELDEAELRAIADRAARELGARQG